MIPYFILRPVVEWRCKCCVPKCSSAGYSLSKVCLEFYIISELEVCVTECTKAAR